MTLTLIPLMASWSISRNKRFQPVHRQIVKFFTTLFKGTLISKVWSVGAVFKFNQKLICVRYLNRLRGAQLTSLICHRPYLMLLVIGPTWADRLPQQKVCDLLLMTKRALRVRYSFQRVELMNLHRSCQRLDDLPKLRFQRKMEYRAALKCLCVIISAALHE